MIAAAPTVREVLSARAPGLVGTVTLPASVLPTPMGHLLAAATDAGVCLLEFAHRRALASELKDLSARFGAAFAGAQEVGPSAATVHLALLARELEAYFAGALR